MRKATALVSVAIHVTAIVLLLLLASIPRVQTSIAHLPGRVMPLLAPHLAERTKPQGGGGQRNPLPASRGQAPPRPVTRIFVPPMAERLDTPKLMVQQAMLNAPDVAITTQNIGDPLGKLGPLSGGPGGPAGIGGGLGPGIGNGPGSGPEGPISYKALGITREPLVIHSVQPEYSEEARKARFQGSVLLAIDVGTDGKVTNVRILRSAGLGLDEKARDAVLKWRFRPAMRGGSPVTAPAQVLMTFHLL